MRIAFVFLVLCLAPLPVAPLPVAHAWNWTGHKIITSIAVRQLTDDEQNRLVALLERHPRFAEDFSEAMPEEVRGGEEADRREWLLQQAAVWPDLIRSGPPAKTAFNRGPWHYINVPHFLADGDRAALAGGLMLNLALDPPAGATTDSPELNIVQVLRLARSTCRDRQADPAARGLLLAWLMHEVGDLHQPLHATALFSRRLFSTGDRGGNSVKTKQAFNLHSLWDQFPGRNDQLREARNAALSLGQDQEHAAAGERAAEQLDERVWMEESHRLAGEHVYHAEVRTALSQMEAVGSLTPIELSENYLKEGGQISQRRLVEAGHRLGAVLKQVVAD